MKKVLGSTSLGADFPSRTVVAIGNFDGVHLGHQSIINQAKARAAHFGAKLVVYTFRPHPTLELRPESPLRLLMTYDEKLEILEKLDVDICVEEPFNSEFSKTSAHDFFFEILKRKLGAVGIVVGRDFFFGRGREGSVQFLKKHSDETGTELIVAKPVELEGSPVSSSRVREALSKGDAALASKLLGRPFFYRAVVVHGDKRGRTIGFPTANMRCGDKFPLKSGVYATSVYWRGKEYPSVSNFGVRPTFQNPELRLETHILDQNFDLYDETMEIRFHHFIRDERKFTSIDELKTQISADTKLARQLLSTRNF